MALSTARAEPEPIVLVADALWPRLDTFVHMRLPHVTRSQAAKLVRDGAITLNAAPSKAAHGIRPGDVVAVALPNASPEPQPETMDIDVVYEDDDVLILDKPAGLVVHPAPGHATHTLVNALLHRYPDLACGDSFRPGIVHRLDKDTSGLMVVARNERARLWLVSQFKQGLVRKEYAALVTGRLSSGGCIDAPIGRHPSHRKRMAVVPSGKPAHTDYGIREILQDYTYVSALPKTGRTHQIRVHFASIGHPVAGDRTYGGRGAARQLQPWLSRHFLHAEKLTLATVDAREPSTFVSPLPSDLKRALIAARGDLC
jgi:23S rRNA pseudouridine1911/1915/1917 synthase